ncbi:putative phospholipid-transporting ATPase 9 [Vigna unguiculata]|uniref:putative phospholipid-transporting ATPase 9 n=1 Tax=Vigna unguiculata TaxID=3917 RepID=UPI001016242E|nr:putative phospholipid-transporting ATPase 9 [Vigna unguiculata]
MSSSLQVIALGILRYACSLLRKDMKKIVITLDSLYILYLQKQGDKQALAKRKQVEGIQIGISDDELSKQVQGKLVHLRERLKQREL